MWGISRGFVVSQDRGDHFCKDFWVHFGIGVDTSAHLFVNQINTSIEGSREGSVVRVLASHPCGPGSIPIDPTSYVG